MYDKPNKSINIYGKNIYAYITSLHNDNLFNFPSLLVFAFSLIKTGSKADRICIVSNDISDDYIELLKIFYKIVRTVDIKINGQTNIKYLSLNMTEYKKIIIINPNFVILQNPDFLFTQQTPMAYFKSKDHISDELLLLEPSVGDFDSMLFDMKHNLIKIDVIEYIYNKYYLYHWNKINDDYFYKKSNIYNIDKVKYIYYTISPVEIIFADLHADDIYLVWYDIYKKMLEKYPYMITNKLLEGTNRMLTNIMKSSGLSREPTAINETNIINIKNIYETNEIHMNLEKYYHIDKTNEPIIDIDPLFEGIEEYSYMEPIKKLYDHFNNNYYKSLNKYTTSENIPLHQYNYIDINDRDHIMLMYLKCMNNIDIILLDGDENKQENKLKIDEFKLNGLYYIKTINFTIKEYENFLFFLKNKISYENRINEIDELKIEQDKQITFVFIKKNPENFEKIIELAELILNQNNLNLLKNQDSRNISTSLISKSLLYIHTLRKWFNSNFSQLDMERIILFGDIVYNAYGIKTIEKIEGVFITIDNDSSEYDKNLENLINETLNNKDTGFYFTRITKENSQQYNKYHKNIIEKILKQAGVEKTLDLVSNPHNYFHYYGLKILKTELNLIHTESQKIIDVKTDLVMTNIVNNNVLSRLITYDKEKRILRTNKKFKLSNQDINKIKLNAKNKYIKKYINSL